MAATSVPINGSALVIRVSVDAGLTWSLIAQAQTATLSRTTETRQITAKASCGWRKLATGMKSWNLSGDGLIVYDAVTGDVNSLELHSYWAVNRELMIQFTVWDCKNNVVNPGDPYYEGKAYITSLEETGSVEDNGTYSFSFEGSDELVDDINP